MVQTNDQKRDKYYQRIYGITLAQYNKILKAQGGVCAVCKSPPKGRAHAVDHDHKSGEIYGLLCFHCNHVLIGRVRDPKLYYSASEYLTKGSGLFVPKKKKKKRGKKRQRLRGMATR